MDLFEVALTVLLVGITFLVLLRAERRDRPRHTRVKRDDDDSGSGDRPRPSR